jgi:hypothetical protein
MGFLISCETVAFISWSNFFSPFAISSRWGLGYVSPLPVELLDFTAKCLEDKTVKIDWSTASENNSSYFEVRKSLDVKESFLKIKFRF